MGSVEGEAGWIHDSLQLQAFEAHETKESEDGMGCEGGRTHSFYTLRFAQSVMDASTIALASC